MKKDLSELKSSKWKSLFKQNRLDMEVMTSKLILRLQLMAIGLLFITYISYLIFGRFFTDFNFPLLWNRTDDIWGSVMKYWYVFAWGVVVTIIIPITNGRLSTTSKIFGLDMIKSTLAGVWEEIGFRGLFIFTSMITIFLSNLFFKYVIVLILGILILVLIFKVRKANLIRIVFIILGVALMVTVIKADLVGDPVYWIYKKIMFPIWHFVSFGLLDPILYNKDFSFLFIVGAMSANIKFRDGHKYQGLFGYVNAWIIGYILLYTMMFYGLWVAIIIHVIYDVLIGLTRFIKRLILYKSEG